MRLSTRAFGVCARILAYLQETEIKLVVGDSAKEAYIITVGNFDITLRQEREDLIVFSCMPQTPARKHLTTSELDEESERISQAVTKAASQVNCEDFRVQSSL